MSPSKKDGYVVKFVERNGQKSKLSAQAYEVSRFVGEVSSHRRGFLLAYCFYAFCGFVYRRLWNCSQKSMFTL